MKNEIFFTLPLIFTGCSSPRIELEICAPRNGAYVLSYHKVSGNCDDQANSIVYFGNESKSNLPDSCMALSQTISLDQCHVQTTGKCPDKQTFYSAYYVNFDGDVTWNWEGTQALGTTKVIMSKVGVVHCESTYDVKYVKM